MQEKTPSRPRANFVGNGKLKASDPALAQPHTWTIEGLVWLFIFSMQLLDNYMRPIISLTDNWNNYSSPWGNNSSFTAFNNYLILHSTHGRHQMAIGLDLIVISSFQSLAKDANQPRISSK